MTESKIFERLFNGGRYALPYLIKIEHETVGTLRFTNDNVDIEFNGETYNASTFDYNPPNLDGTGATLNINSNPGDNTLFEFIENADQNYKITVIGVMVENGEVQPISNYTHFHGVASVNEKGAIEFNLDDDDRLDMTFPPYVFDTDNNRGNA